jgi:hypothetical protein
MSTFNSGLPNNASKIRNYPTLLQNNFRGIEIGDATFKIWQANFPQRNLLPGPPTDDPAALADTSIIYAKEDPAIAGKTELFAIDPDSDVIQLTQGGSLGSATTTLKCSSLTVGTNLNSQNALVSAWAIVASNGVLTKGYGLTSVQNVNGDYTLTFTTPLVDANYVVNGTVFFNGTRARVLYVYNQLAGSFSVRIQATNASAGDYESNIFMVSVMGGRI